VDLDERTLTSVAAYDEHARAYQESLRLRRPVADVRRFAAHAKRGDLVLDAGCGPANDLRLLRDAGVHPVGVDLSLGALREARMLLPRHPLVRAPLAQLPFRPRSFGGLWLSGAFTHLARADWRKTFGAVLEHLDRGPIYFSCPRGDRDLSPVEDPVLGDIFVSAATEDEVTTMLASYGVKDLTVELRPDPILDRRRPLVVALGTFTR
jgi:SAM-dependent methyltransferase